MGLILPSGCIKADMSSSKKKFISLRKGYIWLL